MTLHFFNEENYRFGAQAVSYLAVGSGIAALGIFVLIRERASSIGIKFLFFTATVTVWLLSFGMAYSVRNESSALQWFKISQIGVTFIPAAIFTLTATMVKRELEMRGLIRACLAASSFFCGLLLTTDLHIAALRRYPWGLYPVYGPSGAVFLVYFFIVMVHILSLYYRAYRGSSHPRYRLRMRGMFITFSLGYLAAIDFAAALGISLYPFGYIVMAVFLMLWAWVILRYRLVDITPALAANRILETMNGTVIVTDIDGVIRLVNRAACALLEYQQSELLGRSLLAVVDVPKSWLDLRVLGEGSVRNREIIWRAKSGRRIDVSVSASLITDREGIQAGAAYVVSDITERKKAEEELKQANIELQDFAYIISHDLRSPLVSIKGFSSELGHTVSDMQSLIEKHLPAMDAEDRRSIESLMRNDLVVSLQFIDSSVDRMDGLISSILALSRIGRREIKQERIDMNALTRSILSSMAHQIEQRKVSVSMGSLPEITADRLSMEQIMGNLLDNAVKYLEMGRSGALDISAEQRSGETDFCISDNGRGIAPDDVSKVFEIFKRVGRQDVPGEGMGLAYVKTLVRRQGGRIWCESAPGAGTAFHFTIPHGFNISGMP